MGGELLRHREMSVDSTTRLGNECLDWWGKPDRFPNPWRIRSVLFGIFYTSIMHHYLFSTTRLDFTENPRLPNEADSHNSITLLEDLIKDHPSGKELKRALAVKLALENYSYRDIQKILEVSLGLITKWKHYFEAEGVKGLQSHHRGSQGYLKP